MDSSIASVAVDAGLSEVRGDATVLNDAGAPEAVHADAAVEPDAEYFEPGPQIGAVCADDFECGEFFCGPRNRCARFETATIEPTLQPVTAQALLDSGGQTVIAYTRSGQPFPINVLTETAGGWTHEDTGLEGYVFAFALNPPRFAACTFDGNESAYVATKGPTGWTSRTIEDVVCFSNSVAGAFVQDLFYLTYTRDGEAHAIEVDGDLPLRDFLVDTPPAGSYTDDLPRVGIDENGSTVIAHVSDIPERPGSTVRHSTVRLARRSGDTWSAESVMSVVAPRLGCMAWSAAGNMFVGTQGQHAVFSQVDPTGAATTYVPDRQQWGGGMYCGARGDGIFASTEFDPSYLNLLWVRDAQLARTRVETSPQVFGCGLYAPLQMLGGPGDPVRFLALAAPTSRHVGANCRLTMVTLVDQ